MVNLGFWVGIFQKVDFCKKLPRYALENSWTGKDTVDLVFSAYRGKKQRLPTLNTTVKHGVKAEKRLLSKTAAFQGLFQDNFRSPSLKTVGIIHVSKKCCINIRTNQKADLQVEVCLLKSVMGGSVVDQPAPVAGNTIT